MKICSLNSDTHDVTLCPFYLLAQAIAWLSSHKKRDSALDFFKKISEIKRYCARIYLIAASKLKRHIKHANIPNIT